MYVNIHNNQDYDDLHSPGGHQTEGHDQDQGKWHKATFGRKW